MIVNFGHAYFVLTIPFIIIWIVLFIFSQKTRKEQLIMSLLFLPLGPIYEFLYFQDYWNPTSILSFNIGPFRVLIEDFLFSFTIVGIGAVIYEAALSRRLLKAKKFVNKKLAIFFITFIGILVTCSLFFLGMNSIFATSVGFVAIALFVISQSKGLLINSLVSGLAIMIIMFITYYVGFLLIANTEDILQQIWFLYKSPLGVRVLGIPITEMVWGFAVGMFIGPLYEFIKGIHTI